MHTCLTKLLQNIAYLSVKNVPKVSYFSSIKVVYKPLARAIYEEANEEATKTGKVVAINKLVALFGVSRYQALNCVLKYTNLSKVPGNLIHENYDLCLTNGLTKDTCMKFSGVLAEEELEKKVLLLNKLDRDINHTIPLFALDYDVLNKLIGTDVKRERFIKRLNTFATLFEMPVENICDTFVKRPFLRDMTLIKVEENANLLKRNGITVEAIMKDWWVMKYNSSTIQQRIDIALDNKIAVKTWMVRATNEIFENYLKRRSDNMLILGDSTVAEYLADRLDCSVQESKYIIHRLPALSNKSLKKLEELINFLYAEGFKPNHICRLPKVLLHSVDTMGRRIRELEKQNIKLDSLHLLIKSKKQYLQYYTAVVKANKNKIKAVT